MWADRRWVLMSGGEALGVLGNVPVGCVPWRIADRRLGLTA